MRRSGLMESPDGVRSAVPPADQLALRLRPLLAVAGDFLGDVLAALAVVFVVAAVMFLLWLGR